MFDEGQETGKRLRRRSTKPETFLPGLGFEWKPRQDMLLPKKQRYTTGNKTRTLVWGVPYLKS